ncbi:RNA-directed DNA polymerase from mobile element jockey [Eumeta japonica]|uniref:RNA-directed DNA polymerase from mobile element jockey n=1 Tax=Eumeta variegata TaxID=151549 RepID=A0A4C1YKD2_EUMVA|nr:RNA-directed DNA polymerase from mobile element jockey [Eumeta japonica]
MIDLTKDLHFDIIAPPTQTYFPDNATGTSILNNIPDNIETTDEIDHAIRALTNHIETVVENSSRKVSVTDGLEKIPEDVCVLLRVKNAAMRRTNAYPTCENRTSAQALQCKVKARIQEYKNDKWSTLMEKITPNHQAYWKLAKALKTDGHLPTSTLRKPDNSFTIDDREKAECVADSVEERCSNNTIHDTAHSHRIEEEFRIKISHEPIDDLAPVTIDAVRKHIKSLKIKKAPGLDAWKEAVVTGIPKLGKPGDLPANYRPISLLSELGKLIKKMIKTHLSENLIGKDLIINARFGFRPNHSCPQQIHRLVEHISKGFKKKRKTMAVFFNVAKAFDRVWHVGLTHKLYTLELPDRIIKAGVSQGSTLSPLLYSAYDNDIPRPSNGIQLALFADDTVLYISEQNHPNPLISSAAAYEPPLAPIPKEATEYSVRSAGCPHFRGRKAHRSQKYVSRIVGIKGQLTVALPRSRYPPKSRVNNFLMLSAASDEVVKAFGLTAGPLSCCFRRFFSPCELNTPRAPGRVDCP